MSTASPRHELSEEAVFFGNLFGILSTPSGKPQSTGVILSLTPDMSSSPVSAWLARVLADQGYVTLRFDVMGHGESAEPTKEAVRQHADDFIEAARFLETRSVNSVVLIGAASGARAALAAATELPRVEGLICVVLPVVDTARKVAESVGLREYFRKAIRPSAIRKLADPERRQRYFGLAKAKARSLTRRPPKRPAVETVAEGSETEEESVVDWISTADPAVLGYLSSVIARGVPTLLLNGSDDAQDRDLNRLFSGGQASLRTGDRLELVTIDHVGLNGFPSVAAQDQFIEAVATWIGNQPG